MKRPKILMSGHWSPAAIYNKPFVGLTWNYYEAITRSGGMPILLPYCGELDDYVEMADGLVLTGGYDIDPAVYHEEVKYNTVEVTRVRDDLELALLDKWLKTGKPVLGICRGLQFFNVYFGGSLIQDIPVECGVIHNDMVHKVKLEEGSLMHKLFGDEITTNSFHHQGAKNVPDCFTVTGRSPDGMVEALEHKTLPIVAVQFHPERMVGDWRFEEQTDMTPLFEYFMEMVRRNGSAV
jgi:putative glutamine amidotransferase